MKKDTTWFLKKDTTWFLKDHTYPFLLVRDFRHPPFLLVRDFRIPPFLLVRDFACLLCRDTTKRLLSLFRMFINHQNNHEEGIRVTKKGFSLTSGFLCKNPCKGKSLLCSKRRSTRDTTCEGKGYIVSLPTRKGYE